MCDRTMPIAPKALPARRTQVVAVVLIGALLSALLGQRFLSLATLQGMAFQLPELDLLAFAMAVTLPAGGINLAVVATADLAALATATVLHAVDVPGQPDAWPGTAGFALALTAERHVDSLAK